MTRNPIHLSADSSPIEALSLMLNHHIDSILIYEDRKDLQGIVTPRDFMKTLLLFHQVCTKTSEVKRLRLVDLDVSNGMPIDYIFSRGAQTVRDVMTRQFTHLTPDDTVEKAINLMRAMRIRHLPVADEHADLVGMVSNREILKSLPVSTSAAEEPSGLAGVNYQAGRCPVCFLPLLE